MGLAVASTPAVPLAPLRYNYLEIIRNEDLVHDHGDYTGPVLLDCHARKIIHWWVHNIDSQYNSLRPKPPQLVIS